MKALARWGVVVAVAFGACDGPDQDAELTWIRRGDTASVRLPASAVWCAGPGWLELFAGRNDTGVALAVFPVDSTLEGRFPIVPVRDRADSLRPVAGLAVRWFSDTELLAFEGHDGTVDLELVEGRIGARVTGHLRILAGDDTLDLTGVFPELPLVRGGAQCPVPEDSTAIVLD
jgi:hypothetical protein